MGTENTAPAKDEIAKKIISLCEHHATTTVPGSHIGTHLSALLDPLKFRDLYGPLDGFIQGHCGDKVIRTGRRGGDFLYVHRERMSELSKPEIRLDTASPTRNPVEAVGSFDDQKRLWRAFANPATESSDRVFVQKTTGQLTALAYGATPEHGYLHLEGMRDSDYQGLARSFLDSNVDLDSAAVRGAIERPHFWFEFVEQLRTTKGEDARGKLLRFRVRRIHETARKRLEEAGLGQTQIEFACAQLVRQRGGTAGAEQMPDVANDGSTPCPRVLCHFSGSAGRFTTSKDPEKCGRLSGSLSFLELCNEPFAA